MTEPTAPDLEPCPFCGGDCAYVDGEYEWKDDNRYIELTLETSCDIDLTLRATVNYMQAKGMTKEEKQRVLVDQLSEQWNTRPAPAVTDQARIAAMTITNSTIQAHQIVSDVRSEKTDPLQPYVPHNVVLSALSAIQPEAPSELDTLRETNRLLHRRTQEAESNAYRDAGRWKRRSKRNQQMMNHAFEQSRRYRDVIGPLKIKIASLEFSIRTRSEVRDEALREAAQKIISDTENTLNGLSANAAEICERTILALIDQPAPAPQTVQEAVDVLIQTMRLSGNREEYYVRIACGGRTIETRRYTQGFKNRAEYEVDELRHVLLNEPKPDLLDPKYADPKPDTPPTEGE